MMGCSGNGGNPVTPNDTGTGLTAGTPTHGGQSQTHLWGYWDVMIDVETQTVEAVPNRTAEFYANVVQFINGRPPGLALNINETPIGPDYTDVDIDVSLIHPLPGLPQYDGYDVRGIFIGDGSLSMDYGSGISYADNAVDQAMIPNDGVGGPDGYTRWWNPLEFTIPGVLGYTQGDMATPGYMGTAVINPYKYFADGLGPEDDYYQWLVDNVDSNGVFSSGMTNTRNYYLRFPDAKGVTYGYAVVATWNGEELDDHPAHSHEAMGCITEQFDNLYYIDDDTNGGSIILDISVFGWEGQPSAMWLESTVLSAAYEFDGMDMTPTGGDEYVSTYHVDIPADNVTMLEGNEFWVICESGAYTYTYEFTPPGGAPDATLASFFRFPLNVTEDVPCPQVVPTDCDPGSNPSGQSVQLTITVDNTNGDLEDGGDLAASLQMSGQEDIVGTDVTFVDATTLTADFDLTDAEIGLWNISVTNGCGSAPGVGTELFEVLEAGVGLYIVDSGELPDTLPFPDSKQFCVVGDDVMSHEGVFYFGNNYQVLYYPLDYSSDSSLYMTLAGNYGYTIQTLIGTPDVLDNIEVDGTGGLAMTSNGLLPTWSSSYLQNGPIFWWQANNPAMANGLLLSSSYGSVRSGDVESEFEGFGVLWHYWNVLVKINSGVELVQTGIGYPYDSGSYSSYWNINWAPLDLAGSVDGSVSDAETYRLGVDADPQGLPGSFDIIFYYLEGDPDDAGIEVFQNIKTSLGAARVLITTIDEDFDGEPVDCAVLNTYDNIPTAEGQWLAVLEDYGDSTWTVSLFEQDGTHIQTYGSPQDGDPIALDCDTINMEIHVWADNDGTLEYTIFSYL
jgi:hypothetical protein